MNLLECSCQISAFSEVRIVIRDVIVIEIIKFKDLGATPAAAGGREEGACGEVDGRERQVRH